MLMLMFLLADPTRTNDPDDGSVRLSSTAPRRTLSIATLAPLTTAIAGKNSDLNHSNCTHRVLYQPSQL